jgi:hypothetical protein
MVIGGMCDIHEMLLTTRRVCSWQQYRYDQPVYAQADNCVVAAMACGYMFKPIRGDAYSTRSDELRSSLPWLYLGFMGRTYRLHR